ncbi:hypothetical protein M409DRAFT_63630 [Zasmidium cellare ATCC 36951]|uniref:Uncharacterized protein n=1 Tax=Zasmidium cellare ATCC 36951 TaxID=1080233 RepID=A0A6A6CW79_ZASCE|nr:uncharacterized protein M409DRAFT_63630 [Zasmidium cellare ATCC 36951]KAF2171285.1 hypothetical protein M409DRAFT_63630 [Zasmidium cellare ATCC 36951]
MIGLAKDNGPKPRCLVTNAKLSNFLNHEQPPTKKRPFSTILNQTYTHTLTLLLPTTTTPNNPFQTALSASPTPWTLHHLKLHLNLSSLLTNPFFTTYIKSPPASLTLLSLPSSNPYAGTFTLHEGLLALDLDRPTYERVGLQGKPTSTSGGRKHVKDRFLVELNLRLPSMVHGKKGFERIVWAFENVLNETCTWLAVDARSGGFESLLQDPEVPIKDFAPLERNVRPAVSALEDVLVPAFPDEGGIKEEDYADAEELLEWITLAMLNSPRIRKDDGIDKHFSRYQVPDSFGETETQNLSKFRWRGLIPPEFAYKVFLAALKASGDDWVALSAEAFNGETYTILVHKGQSITWEYKD